MAVLTLRFENEYVSSHLFKGTSSLTIGRNKNNDVVIENLGVSGHHAKIDCLSGRFLVTDLQSKNGTFVNNQLVASRWLEHGDSITIGKHVIHFDLYEDDPSPGQVAEMSEKTMVLDTDQYQALLATSYKEDRTEEVKKEMVGVLSIVSGGGREYRLTKKMTNIGKAPFNDIVVGGLFVGKISATISQRPSGYHLSYVSGWSKPKVNGKTVTQSSVLDDLDIIQIGSTKMRFALKPVYRK